MYCELHLRRMQSHMNIILLYFLIICSYILYYTLIFCSNFRYICPYIACSFSSTSLPSLRNHGFRYHKDQVIIPSVSECDTHISAAEDVPEPENNHRCFRKREFEPEAAISSRSSTQGDINKSDIIDEIKKSFIKLFLQARDGFCLPESTAKHITLQGFQAIRQFHDNYLSFIRSTLETVHVEEKTILDYLDFSKCFDEISL